VKKSAPNFKVDTEDRDPAAVVTELVCGTRLEFHLTPGATAVDAQRLADLLSLRIQWVDLISKQMDLFSKRIPACGSQAGSPR
jgi:hypothetical protein